MRLLNLLLAISVASIISLRRVQKSLKIMDDGSDLTVSRVLCFDAAKKLMRTLDNNTMTVACPFENQFQFQYDAGNGGRLLLEKDKRMSVEEAQNFIRKELSFLLESDHSNMQFPIKFKLPSAYYMKWLWERVSLGRPDELSLVCADPLMRAFLADHLDDPVGLGPFTSLLGKGGYGSVHACKASSGENLAVKVVKLESGFLKNYIDEIAALKLVKDIPYFVKLHSAQVRDFSLELIFERLDGINGYQMLDKHGTIKDLSILAAVARIILTGIKVLHLNGYRHDDIKYDNIIFTREGQLKIIDFGLATKMDKRFKADGIPGLCGPERFNRKYAPSASSDIWMLASMLLVAHADPDLSCCTSDRTIPTLNSLPDSELKAFLESIFQLDPATGPTIDELLESPFISLAASDEELQNWIRALFTPKV